MKHLKNWKPNKDVDHIGTTNMDRADRAERVAEYYATEKGESIDECNLGDLLADILHAYAARGVDPRTAIDTALIHFEAER